jgi:hypothetical protein
VRAFRITLLALALLVVAFVATWATIPNKEGGRGVYDVGLPARVFLGGLKETTNVHGEPLIARQNIDALERRVVVFFGGAAAVVVLLGLAFGVRRRPAP